MVLIMEALAMASKGKKSKKLSKKRAVVRAPRPKKPGDGYKTQRPAAETNFIRQWRLFRGIKTQGELADLSGLARPQISNLESGLQSYKQEHLEALAVPLKCTPSDLISVDPFKAGDIFTIYRALPETAKKAVDALVRQLHPTASEQPAE
jgi:transcriptional regulator with XRE-family HTH domain